MKSKILKFIRSYSIYSVLFLLYLAVFIFIGFLHIYINHWTLITAFVSYAAILFVYFIVRHAKTKKLALLLVSLIITSFVFWGLTAVFGHTFDTSYDGQGYHQSAVFELSDKWDPVYQKSMPIKLINPVDEPNITGYGKILWAVDSSVYKLTNNIDSVTAINLIVGLLAFSFLYFALLSLGIEIFPVSCHHIFIRSYYYICRTIIYS